MRSMELWEVKGGFRYGDAGGIANHDARALFLARDFDDAHSLAIEALTWDYSDATLAYCTSVVRVEESVRVKCGRHVTEDML